MEVFFKKLAICFSTCILIAFTLTTSLAEAKRFSSDVPLNAQATIQRLDSIVGIDIHRNIITKPYSESMIDNLSQALRSKYFQVRNRSLTLMEHVVKKFRISRQIIDQKIKPAMEEILANEGNFLAKRVLWQIQLNRISDENERLEFLKIEINKLNASDNYYFFEALNYFADTGNENAKFFLEGSLNEAIRTSMAKDRIAKLEVSMEKIMVVRAIGKIDANNKVKTLSALIDQQKMKNGVWAGEMGIWLIRKLKSINDLSTVTVLKSIWNDKTFSLPYRYEAQEILIELNEINARERSLIFDL